MTLHVTRGSGLLETLLAKKRAARANRLILPVYRTGRIADIGCGFTPLFLLNTPFREKYGLDKVVDAGYGDRFPNASIRFRHFDMEKEGSIPFENDFFDIVTLLAVFEHLEAATLERLLSEIHRILKPEGLFIMTTPAFWTKNLLKGMAKLKLISPVEIEEHKAQYTIPQITAFLKRGGFSKEKIRTGTFEFFMNTWAVAKK